MKDLESTLNTHAERRRDFLVKGGNAAAAAPALALLLQAGVKPAYAKGYADAGAGSPTSPGTTVTGQNPITETVTVPIMSSTTQEVTTTTDQVTTTGQ